MLRTVLAVFLIAFAACPVLAKDIPDFNSLKKSWGNIDSLTITKSAGYKYTVAVKKGPARVSRDMYMIAPDKPELLLWRFHGYKPDGEPYKQSPEIFIKSMGLSELNLPPALPGVNLTPALKCSIILLSEEKSIYRSQAEIAARVPGAKKIEFIENIGKGRPHDWEFWGSADVKKILDREVQAAGEN